MAAVEVRERTSPGVNGHAPDPRALAVVGVLQGRLPDTKEIVLFGSRAMGNWQPWSDLDLAVSGVPADRASEDSLHQQAVAIVRDQYDRESPSVQIFQFPRSEFEACRTSHSHIAGQVQYWGIAATGNPLPHMTQDNPWPAVQAHLQSAHNDLGEAGETPNPNVVMAVLAGQAKWQTLLPEGYWEEGNDHVQPPEPNPPLGTL